MLKLSIIINEENRKEIQLLGYEVSARDKIVCHMLEKDMDTDTASFKKYHEEYKELFCKHELAMRNIEMIYVLSNPDVIAFGGKVNWNLDYASGVMEITGVDEKESNCCSQSCHTGI